MGRIFLPGACLLGGVLPPVEKREPSKRVLPDCLPGLVLEADAPTDFPPPKPLPVMPFATPLTAVRTTV